MPNAIGPGEVCPRFGHYAVLILIFARLGVECLFLVLHHTEFLLIAAILSISS